MALNARAIKGRIKSVKNTKKITRAMQMVSAAKMRKAVESTLNTKIYAQLADEFITQLSKSESGEVIHPLLAEKEMKNELIVVISSNRGLCGSFNAKIINETGKYLEERDSSIDLNALAIGKKGAKFVKKQNIDVIALYEDIGDNPSFEDTLVISNDLIEKFKNNEYQKVSVIYTNYISGLKQDVKVKQVLPVTQANLRSMIDDLPEDDSPDALTDQVNIDYVLEPNKKELLNYVLPKIVQIQVYQAILESTASEHSSRMIAMKNASEAAGDMVNDLNLQYNKARQASITQEIAEIAGGAAALE